MGGSVLANIDVEDLLNSPSLVDLKRRAGMDAVENQT
jgi:hypothetical protein